jgi:integrase
MTLDDEATLPEAPYLALHHIIQALPLRGLGAPCPALFVENGLGQIALHEGATSWARSELMQRDGRGIATNLRVLGRLHDFQQVAWQGQPITAEDRRAFIWCYLDARYHGTDGRPELSALQWKPVGYANVRGESRTIIGYHEFLNSSGAWDRDGFSSSEYLTDLTKRLRSESTERRRSFLDHLATSRARWNQLFGDGYSMPDLKVREQPRSSTTFSLTRTIDLEEAILVIKHEKNPFYRAMWTLAAFGGPRISEMLHMWQCDVLPPSTGRHALGRDQDTLFVVIAEPAQSRYIGDFTRSGSTRHQHLAERYGLQPRHHLRGYRRVGWKHPLMTNTDLLFAEVFWCNDEMAADFAESMAKIRHFHSRNQTSRRHPYLFVNMPRGRGFSEPISYNKAREAFARACRRVGLEPAVNGRRIHGLRHVYKAQLDRLRVDRRHIQIAMRHKSVESQDDYGRTARELRAVLAEHLHWERVS